MEKRNGKGIEYYYVNDDISDYLKRIKEKEYYYLYGVKNIRR